MLAGDLELVKDINDLSEGSNPQGLVAAGDYFYFYAKQGELWQSNGTSGGTRPVVDAAGSGMIAAPGINVSGVMYFTRTTTQHGNELWRTDGTPAGTILVKDIRPGAADSSIGAFANLNGTLFFTANDGVHGRELWKSDGTELGTTLVKDLPTGTEHASVRGMTAAGNYVYYIAKDSVGEALWRSDGTASGTQMVTTSSGAAMRANFSTHYLFDAPQLASVNGLFYFAANHNASGFEMWRTDGTEAGTFALTDFHSTLAGDPAYSSTNVNGVLYFVTEYNSNSDKPAGLWKTDGTIAGTQFVRAFFREFAYVNGKFFTRAYDAQHGEEPWALDLATNQTQLIRDIRSGPEGSLLISSSFLGTVPQLTTVDNMCFFYANEGSTGFELWKSDGTVGGTAFVKDIRSGSESAFQTFGTSFNPRHSLAFKGKLYVRVDDGRHGYELWTSDGTEQGTVLLKDIVTGAGGSGPENFLSTGSALYFTANDGVTSEWWRSDGSAAETKPFKEIHAGLNNVSLLANVNGLLYFTATSSSGQRQLWKSDGTQAGLQPVTHLLPVVGGFANINNVLYFTANDGASGTELWKTDGSPSGTKLVKDIASGPASSTFGQLVAAGNLVYFTLSQPDTGAELWRTDGTSQGTFLVKDIQVGPQGSKVGEPINVGGTLYFRANDGFNGYELWKSDGTAAGTTMVRDRSGANSLPESLTALGSNVFFSAYESTGGRVLWKSDGTEGGTVIVKDFGYTQSNRTGGPYEIISVGDKLFFSRLTLFFAGYETTELWVSDGTTNGTTLLKQSAAPGYFFRPRFLRNGGSQLLFNSGVESGPSEAVWTSDGTVAGTKPLLTAGQYIDGGRSSALVGDRLFIAGGLPGVGRELASLNTLTAPAQVGDFDRNNTVNQLDYNRWFTTFGSMTTLAADANALGGVDAADYTLWRDNQTTAVLDYNRDGTVSIVDQTFWAANFGATTGVGLQADGALNGTVDAADYTVWRDAIVPPARTDFNSNGRSDLADLDMWQGYFGATTAPALPADGNNNHIVDAADYTLWRDAYVPPTAAAPTIAIASAAVSASAAPSAEASRVPRVSGGSSAPLPRLTLGAHDARGDHAARLLMARDAAFAELGDDDNPSTRAESPHIRRASQPVGRVRVALKFKGLGGPSYGVKSTD